MTRYAPLWEQAGSYAAGVDRRLLSALWPAATISGMAVTATSGMTLAVAPGSAAVPTSNSTGSVLCVSDAIENVTLTAAPASGNSRIDVVYVLPRGNDLDGGVNNDFIFAAAAGTPAPSAPAVPAIPAGAAALANIAVGGGVGSIVAGNITDQRPAALMAAGIPATYPRGTLAQASATTFSSNVTSGNTNWMTAAPAVTVDGTRRLKITYSSQIAFGAANDLGGLMLKDGAAQLGVAQVRGFASGGAGQVGVCNFWEGVPAAGTHTYIVAVFLNAGTQITGVPTGSNPAFVIVEDVGT